MWIFSQQLKNDEVYIFSMGWTIIINMIRMVLYFYQKYCRIIRRLIQFCSRNQSVKYLLRKNHLHFNSYQFYIPYTILQLSILLFRPNLKFEIIFMPHQSFQLAKNVLIYCHCNFRKSSMMTRIFMYFLWYFNLKWDQNVVEIYNGRICKYFPTSYRFKWSNTFSLNPLQTS